MDALTARHLAGELSARWSGRRLSGIAFERGARAVVVGVVGQEAIRFDLSRADVTVTAVAGAALDDRMSGWTVHSVESPEDDRRLLVHLVRPGRFRGSPERVALLEICAIPTARGAALRDAGGRAMVSLGARVPPSGGPRPLLTTDEIRRAVLAGDEGALLRGRWMSPMVARWLLSHPEHAAERYVELAGATQARPAWCGGQLVAFPTCEGATPAASLVAPASGVTPPPVRTESTKHRERARQRMIEELERAREAPRVRRAADALLALGASAAPPHIALDDGAGVDTGAADGESAADAARRLYATARSMERALALLPARIAARGERAPSAHAPSEAPRQQEGPERGRRKRPAPRAFRSYRSSGGLEIRVGRGAAANDRLTFHASAPDEVWLHARDASGAHVLLAWREPTAPPARDLEEAALLAAWHSKARGSTIVPVDWTRRKYVRKPRGAAAGLVTLERARTLFVRPDGDVERRLRDETFED